MSGEKSNPSEQKYVYMKSYWLEQYLIGLNAAYKCHNCQMIILCQFLLLELLCFNLCNREFLQYEELSLAKPASTQPILCSAAF